MKKVLLSGLLTISILSMVSCSTNKDYCNHDFLNSAQVSSPNPYKVKKVYDEITLDEIKSIRLLNEDKYLGKTILDINKEDILNFYNKLINETSDENTVSLSTEEYNFIFDKEDNTLISITSTNKSGTNIRDIKIGDLLDNVINKLPKDTSLMDEYYKGISNRLELNGTNSFRL